MSDEAKVFLKCLNYIRLGFHPKVAKRMALESEEAKRVREKRKRHSEFKK